MRSARETHHGDAAPEGELSRVRDAVRAAIGDMRGPDRVPEKPQWWPHVSLLPDHGKRETEREAATAAASLKFSLSFT